MSTTGTCPQAPLVRGAAVGAAVETGTGIRGEGETPATVSGWRRTDSQLQTQGPRPMHKLMLRHRP